MRFFIELSYNGKAYHGWQNQPNAISVQEVLEKALSTILKSEISIMGAGRTDAGVHASQMFAHFDCDTKFNSKDLVYKLNSFLPKDIAVRSVFEVKPEIHARFYAVSRTYNYKISTAKNVFDYDYSYLVHLPLDIASMNEACKILLAYKDFQCFSKTNTDVKTYNCDIMEAFWTKDKDELMFTIKADRFLRNMVRAIVGTMINIGMGKLKPHDLHQIIASKKRSEAGFSVPAQGLYLVNIVYPEDIRIEN
ncbi:tRNA pseudouridine(38-40) synthase TruA [Winogradskyella eckloniae]|uniref:tRNA pseudouridine(38-40) synthase TruA n=1 Tax=Winogradskyella eckloniae TaxID=1089306 RepID=UPI001563AAB5|nr:tRNA pseudouridine(38-40) synthase TruA [Winogradskyella eckloniae]NRD19530.1 tRNA pseudouridine(38-40) synthase TruA [Winogradskyella eckloniae]